MVRRGWEAAERLLDTAEAEVRFAFAGGLRRVRSRALASPERRSRFRRATMRGLRTSRRFRNGPVRCI